MEEKSIQDLKKMQVENQAFCLIDVRTPSEYASGHIPGAINMPLGSIHNEVVKQKAEGKKIITACRSGGRSKQACQQLLNQGFQDVASLAGGTEAWQQQGYSVEGTGKDVMSIERQVRIVAGLLVLLGVGFGYLIAPVFFALAAFVGAGLVFSGVTDFCGMAIVLGKLPYNNQGSKNHCAIDKKGN